MGQRTMETDIAKETSILAQRFADIASQASDEKKSYAEKLEGASDDTIFKYLLLSALVAHDSYVMYAKTNIYKRYATFNDMSIKITIISEYLFSWERGKC